MNERIEKLTVQARAETYAHFDDETFDWDVWHTVFQHKFAELIVEECRTVVNDLYHKTPLELCGPLLTADEEIAKHFYGVEE